MIPRPYQCEAVRRAGAELAAGQSTIVVCATGLGKSGIGWWIIKDWLGNGGTRVLWLAHRDELIRQAEEEGHKIAPEVGVEIEMAEQRAAVRRDLNGPLSKVVIASKDSLWQNHRLHRFAPDAFDLVVTDEVHHASQDNKTYQNILDHFAGAKRLGLTATPNRTDGKALGANFASVAYVYDIRQAIEDGYLVPLIQEYIKVDELDLSKLKVSRQGDGEKDFSAVELDALMREEAMLHKVVGPARELANHGGERRPTLVFAASVHHAELLAQIFNRHEPGSAVCIHGGHGYEFRRDELRKFKSGQVQFLCNMGIFLEGYNDPSIRMVVDAQPTLSLLRYTQRIGRGTRPLPGVIDGLETAAERKSAILASKKPGCLICDFCGSSGKHKLVSTTDVLGGIYPEEVRRQAEANVRENGGRGRMDAELEYAQRQLAEKEAERRRHIVAEAKYRAIPVDPFDYLDIPPPRFVPGRFRGQGASEKQIALLEKLGVPVPDDLGKFFAMKLLDAALKKRNEGPPSPKQAGVLVRYGFKPEECTWSQASRIIDDLANNGWKG